MKSLPFLALLLAGLLLVCGAPSRAEAPAAPAAAGELLDVDADAAAPPAAARGAPLPASGLALRAMLPWSDAGSWIRLRLVRVPAQPVLAVDTPLAATITLRLPDGTALVRNKLAPGAAGGGSALMPNFALPDGLRAGDVLWVHVAHRARAPVALLLLDGEDWRRRERRLLVATATVYGLLLALALVAACQGAALREPMSGYFALHVLALMGFMGASMGFLYAWPGGDVLAASGMRLQWALGAWATGLAYGFAQHFLSIRRDAPALAPVFDGARRVLLVAGALILCSPVVPPWLGAALSAVLMATNVFLLGVAARLAWRGSRFGGYFLAGWLPFTVPATLRALQGLGVPAPADIDHVYALGAVCEAFMFALGLSDRVRSVRRERDSTREAAAVARQLALQNDTLKENVRLREQVDRMSRHDLRTPLNSIVAVPRLVRESGPLAPVQDELLALVERAGFRALNMVNLSLDLLKMEQQAYAWEPVAVDIDHVLACALADLRALADAGGVDVVVRHAGGGAGPVAVLAEETLCYSILANLLKNAVEAAPRGSAVTVLVERGDPVRLHIHNEGAVAPAMAARFFEKYATHGKPGGTGFGTYSARLMARIQRGELTLRTSEADGTTLSLHLCAAPAPAPAAALPDARGPEPSAWPARSVMLVDDDEHNLMVLGRLLPAPPLSVRSARDGRAALEALAADPADVVFMDLEMPVMSGFEAVAALRELERARGRAPARVVALSSHDDANTRAEALARGFDLYLRKPVDRAALHAVLCDGVDTRAAAPPEAVGSEAPVLLDPDLRDALAGFLATRRQALDEMAHVLRAGDVATVRRLAHRLSGSFALYGFRWAAQACEELEHRAGEMPAAEVQRRLEGLRAHLETADVRFDGAATA